MEKESGVELKRKLRAVFDAARQQRGSELAAQAELGEAALEDRIKTLPDQMQADVRMAARELEEDGIKDPAKRTKHLDRLITTHERLFQDRRFTVGPNGERMSNTDFGWEKGVNWLSDMLDAKDSKPEDLKKVALINFDANCLKTVNDLSSHRNGTEYLRRIAVALNDKDGETATWLRVQGINEIIPMSAGGGDEYGVLLRSEKAIDGKILEEAVRRFEVIITQIDVSDLVDFEDPATLKKLREKGVTMGVPPGFKMHASASGGAATMYDGMIAAIENPDDDKRIESNDRPNVILNKTVGGLWDTTEHAANSSKVEFKASKAEAKEGTHDRFYGEILTLGRKSAEDLVRETELKAKKRSKIDEDITAAAELVMDGVWTREKYNEFKRQKEDEKGLL